MVYVEVVQTEIDSILAADPAERQHQLELLRAAFIPWLATIDPDTDAPVRRRANWTDLPDDSRPLVDRMVDKRLLVKATRDNQVVVEVALESLLRQWDQLAGWLADQRHNLQDRRRPAPHRRRLALQRPRPGLAADRHPPARRAKPWPAPPSFSNASPACATCWPPPASKPRPICGPRPRRS